jgi:putative ABC transport system permease protein
MGDRTAALVGPQLMRRYGWHKGQRVTLKGSFRRVDLSFTIVGTATFFSDQSNFMFHREYLEEALGAPGIVSMFWVKAPSVTEMPALIGRINETFSTSSEPVKAMSQKQLISSFLSLLGDVRGVVGGMGVLVMIAVFFVTLNSMALSARERVPEIAVLKAIGFPAGDVLASMLFEGLVIGLVGGGVGAGAAWVVFNAFPLELGFGPLSGFSASPVVVGVGLGIAAVTGMLATLPPALRAVRLPVVEALRRRD